MIQQNDPVADAVRAALDHSRDVAMAEREGDMRNAWIKGHNAARAGQLLVFFGGCVLGFAVGIWF